MQFTMLDDRQYGGRSYKDVVAAMADDKLRNPRTLASYRTATARRVQDAYDVTIDTATDARFIKSLVKAGLMERVA